MPDLAMVTGANGHLGNNLAKALAERGYRVRASVRDATDLSRTRHLAEVGIDDVVSLDVRRADDFQAASSGVDVLFHCAATYRYYTGSAKADDEMVRDSLEGAAAAIRAAQANGIGKVVLTSSAVTLPLVERGGPAVTEEAWRTDLTLPYFRAKTLAEKQALELARTFGIRLVTILPGAIIGPGFLKRTTSTDLVECIMRGTMKSGSPNLNVPFVDIRDVVRAHILAAEKECSGRYAICNDRQPYMIDVTRMMNAIDPSVPAAPRNLPNAALRLGPVFDWLNSKTLGSPRLLTGALISSTIGREWAVSSARAERELGWRAQVPLEQSLAETMAALRILGPSGQNRRAAA
jgi:dihydroflavonol-4-reductase